MRLATGLLVCVLLGLAPRAGADPALKRRLEPPPPKASRDDALARGDLAFAASRYEEAAAAYQEAAAALPGDPVSRYRQGVALAALGDLARAVIAWERVLLIAPHHARARRNIELARRRLSARSAELDDQPLTIARARSLIGDGRGCSARALLDKLVSRRGHAHDAEALALRGQARLLMGDARGALEDLLQSLPGAPADPTVYRALAAAYRAVGDAASGAYFEGLAR